MPVLYSLSLQRPTAIVQAVQGNFSAARVQEVVVARGKVLELLRPDDQGKVQCIYSSEVFGIIRCISTFRLTGATRDYIVVGSDSGRLVVLEFNTQKNVFERAHCEPYGKTGIRRVVPGEYVAVDPKGRAVMIAAIERQKFVYILNRDGSANLTISSPLEAHKSNYICHDLIGVEMGFENPMFASLEQQCEPFDLEVDPDRPLPAKGVSFWEMDLGLNHVIKKATLPVHLSAHLLIPVPGGSGTDGPSGVLVCCENYLVYKKMDHEDVYCAIPRRLEMGQDRGLCVVCYAVHKMRDFFFLLIQTDYGDLYKVEVIHEDGIVREVTCRYFDTLPVANSICVLKSGYLFVAAEFGNHLFYQFTGIGTDETDPMCSSAHPMGKDAIIACKPRPLKNLLLADEMLSLAPITDVKVVDCQGVGTPQIYAACGRGPRSTLRILQHGLGIEEMADNELPGRARAVWTVRESNESIFDKYIIVGFEGSCLVLAIGDTVEEVTESCFLANVTTIHIALLFDESYIQIHENGIRHVLGKRVYEWRVPGGRKVKAGSSNERQIVVSLSGGELVYFEVDESHTMTEVAKKTLGVETTCMAVQPVPEGRTRGSFLAVGGLDNIVRILSLEKDRNLRQLTTQLLPNNATPESVCLLQTASSPSNASSASRDEVGKNSSTSSSSSASSGGPGTLFLNVGLNTGVMLTSVVDPVMGSLSDHRSRFLGGRAVKFHVVRLNQSNAMLALSEKTWLNYSFQGKTNCVPLNYDTLEYAASFCSEQCQDGFVAIAGESLRIFRCHRLGEVFNQTIFPLSYTPRRIAALPRQGDLLGAGYVDGVHDAQKQAQVLVVVEADHNAYDENTKIEIRKALKGIKLNEEENEDEKNDENDNEADDLPESQCGTFKAGACKWGSCIRIINPLQGTTVDKISLDADEAALSCCAVELEGLNCLVVGCATSMCLRPRQVPMASIRVYTYDDNFKFHLIHTTSVEDVPMAFAPYRGKLLVGVGNRIRLYQMGKKKLLKKSEYRNLPENIVWLRVAGDRIFAGDLRESIHVLKYRQADNLLFVLCDDLVPRWITTAEVLDYHSVICADKFDSVFVARVPPEARQDEGSGGDVSGLRLRGDTSYLTGRCTKLQHLAQFHVGELVTGLQKAVLTPGGSEFILYTTVMGSIGAFLPFHSKEEMDFFHHLEMIMRGEKPPLCGRDHIVFRSYYYPVQNVVDGDLCEQFVQLPPSAQKRIATDMDRTPAEVLKRLEEIKNRIM